MMAACSGSGLPMPKFEELGANFRTTLFGEKISRPKEPEWQVQLLEYLSREGEVSTAAAARLWRTSDRTARTRLRQLVVAGVLGEVGQGPRDPHRSYVLKVSNNG